MPKLTFAEGETMSAGCGRIAQEHGYRVMKNKSTEFHTYKNLRII